VHSDNAIEPYCQGLAPGGGHRRLDGAVGSAGAAEGKHADAPRVAAEWLI
jgi:hypothetical protein